MRWALPLTLRPLRMASRQESAWTGSLVAPATPRIRLLRSFPLRPAFRSVIDSATPAVQCFLFNGGCAGASCLLYWYRVSSCLLNHDPDVTQARCSPEVQRNAYSKSGTHDDYTHLVPSFHSLRQPSALASLGGVGAVSLGHTLRRCRHPALPCYRSTVHRHRLSTKSPQGFAAILSHIKTAVLTSMSETDTSCRISLTHVSIFTAQCDLSPCI